jgi:hypothetical protein
MGLVQLVEDQNEVTAEPSVEVQSEIIAEQSVEDPLNTENPNSAVSELPAIPESAISSLEKGEGLTDDSVQNAETEVVDVEKKLQESEDLKTPNKKLKKFKEDLFEILITDKIIAHLHGVDKNNVVGFKNFKDKILEVLGQEFFINRVEENLNPEGVTNLLRIKFSSYIEKGTSGPFLEQEFFNMYPKIIKLIRTSFPEEK